jgi:hypothetical protein
MMKIIIPFQWLLPQFRRKRDYLHMLALPHKRIAKILEQQGVVLLTPVEEIFVNNIAGFRPRRRAPFVSAKGPKTIFARSRPLRDAFAPTPNYMTAQRAEPALSIVEGLKQSPPNSLNWHRGSNAPNAIGCKSSIFLIPQNLQQKT